MREYLKKNQNQLAAVFLVSLAIQLLYLQIHPLDFPKKDAVMYDTIGFNIAAGKGFTFDGITPFSLYPLYPLLLSIIYFCFGHNYFLVQFFSSICVSVSCVCIYIIGRELFCERTALLSAFFTALYVPFFALSRIMYPEPVFIMLLYLSTLLYILSLKKKNLSWVFLSGISMGLAIMTKPHVIYFSLIISISFLFSFPLKRAAIFILLFNLAVACCMAPWIARNYIVFGDFRLVNAVAIKDGRISKVDILQNYDSAAFIKELSLKQKNALDSYYRKARIVPEKSIKSNALGGFVDSLTADYTSRSGSIPKFLTKMYFTSYSDILDITLPYNAFVKEGRFAIAYWNIFIIKTATILLSSLIFLLALIGMVINFGRRIEFKVITLFFVSYTVFLYLWITFILRAGACGRYSIPVLGFLILFAVDAFLKGCGRVFNPLSRNPRVCQRSWRVRGAPLFTREYKDSYNEIFFQKRLQDQSGFYDESAIPSYIHKNALMSWLFWKRIDTALLLAGELKNKKVLDFGCGNGVLFKYLCEKKCRVFGCEDAYFDLVNEICKRLDLEVKVSRDLNSFSGEKFDIIFALDVFEHIENIQDYLGKFRSLSHKDTLIIISGPTENLLYKIGRWCAGFSGSYHLSDVYSIEKAFRLFGFKRKAIKRLFPGIPLFRVSLWKAQEEMV